MNYNFKRSICSDNPECSPFCRKEMVLFLLSICLVAPICIPLFLDPKLIKILSVGESSLVETITATLYLASAVILIYKRIKISHAAARRQFTFWLLISLILLGEETSWLQHILGYATPEWLIPLNYQGEMNVHNLHTFRGASILESLAKPKLSDVRMEEIFGAQTVFRIIFYGYFVLLPLTLFGWTYVSARVAPEFVIYARSRLNFLFPVAPIGISILFGLFLLCSYTLSYIYSDSLVHRNSLEEVRELGYSIIMTFHIATRFICAQHNKACERK